MQVKRVVGWRCGDVLPPRASRVDVEALILCDVSLDCNAACRWHVYSTPGLLLWVRRAGLSSIMERVCGFMFRDFGVKSHSEALMLRRYGTALSVPSLFALRSLCSCSASSDCTPPPSSSFPPLLTASYSSSLSFLHLNS